MNRQKKSDAVILANKEENEMLLLKLQKEIGSRFNIKSPSVSFAKLLELANERLIEIQYNNDLGVNVSKR